MRPGVRQAWTIVIVVLSVAPLLLMAYNGVLLTRAFNRDVLSYSPFIAYEIEVENPPLDSVKPLDDIARFMYYAITKDEYSSKLFWGPLRTFDARYWLAMITYGRVEGFGSVTVIVIPNIVGSLVSIDAMTGGNASLWFGINMLVMSGEPPGEKVNLTLRTVDGGNVTFVLNAVQGPPEVWEFVDETLGWDINVHSSLMNKRLVILAVPGYAFPTDSPEERRLAEAVRSISPDKYVMVLGFDAASEEVRGRAIRYAAVGVPAQFTEHVRGWLEGRYGVENVEFKFLWEDRIGPVVERALVTYLAMLVVSPLLAVAAVIASRLAMRRGWSPGRRDAKIAFLALAVSLALFVYLWVPLQLEPAWPNLVIVLSSLAAVGLAVLFPRRGGSVKGVAVTPREGVA